MAYITGIPHKARAGEFISIPLAVEPKPPDLTALSRTLRCEIGARNVDGSWQIVFPDGSLSSGYWGKGLIEQGHSIIKHDQGYLDWRKHAECEHEFNHDNEPCEQWCLKCQALATDVFNGCFTLLRTQTSASTTEPPPLHEYFEGQWLTREAIDAIKRERELDDERDMVALGRRLDEVSRVEVAEERKLEVPSERELQQLMRSYNINTPELQLEPYEVARLRGWQINVIHVAPSLRVGHILGTLGTIDLRGITPTELLAKLDEFKASLPPPEPEKPPTQEELYGDPLGVLARKRRLVL